MFRKILVSTRISIGEDMDLVIENPGFSHIGEKIFNCLDFNTQSTCRLVKKSWKIMLEKKPYKLNWMLTVDFLLFDKYDDIKMWIKLVRHVHFKLKSRWIDIYLQEKHQEGLNSSPIATLVKNDKMTDLIFEEKLYTFCQFYIAVKKNHAMKRALYS